MPTLPNIKLKTALWKKRIKQIDLSFAIKIDPGRLSKIINGYEYPTWEIKKEIARFLEMEVEELF